MKTYNKKILEATKNLSNKTYQKAMDNAQKATHPSPQVLKIGAVISLGIGLTLLTTGFVGLVLKKEILAWGLFISGTIVIMINFTNATKK